MNYEKWRALLVKRFSFPKERSIKRALRSFTIAERMVFNFLVAVFILSGLVLLLQVNNSFLTKVPVHGGSLTEGVVGNPRFINPVLAISEADKNLTTLVYSGLLRTDLDGNIVNDLAESFEVSPNGLSYTVSIAEDAVFHDGVPVTADDVIFTIQKATDPMIKSPRRGNWEGVTITKVDEKTLTFTLKTAYAPFVENLTMGILPRHIWKNVSEDEFAFSQFNTVPVGSGPYEVVSVERNSGGIPDYYELRSFQRARGGEPYIEKLVFKFYPSEGSLVRAWEDGDIQSVSGLSADEAKRLESQGANILTAPLPRVFGVFFNQSQSQALLDKSARAALDLAAPKERIIETVLNGYGTPIDGPLPAGLFSWTAEREDISFDERLARASSTLASGGWVKNPQTGVLEKKAGNSTISLSFSISTGDAPELRLVAEELVTAWRELGADVQVEVYETGDLNQSIIRPRKFQGLLFGEVVGRNADVYPFWHSSQRNDPGLNIAMYANGRADKLLEAARSEQDKEAREESYKAFHNEIRADVPAVFLYSPSFIYIVPDKVKNVELRSLSTPQDRFLGIRNWYIEEAKVWKLFTQ